MADRPNKTGLGDGGPAFPTPCDGFGGMTYGMSLRDWFAGQALAGLIAQSMAKGIFHAPEWHLRALKKLNDGGMYPLDVVAKAAGSQSVDGLITALPRLAEKLGDIGVTLTFIKNFGVRITRSASV